VRVPPELLRLIRENKKFLVVSHINPEGDSIGSSIALALGLKKIEKYAYNLSRDAVPEILRFLPSSNLFSRSVPSQEFDVMFLIDCSTLKRTGFKGLRAENTVVIDHHCPSKKSEIFWRPHTKYLSWVDPDASATGELIYKLLSTLRIPIDKEIATNLYTAIFTDTGGFRYANTTPESLNIASRLIKAGADPWEITKEVYESFPFNRLRLLGLCLKTLKRQGKLAWVTITREMYKKTNTLVEDIEGFVEYPRKIKGIEVAILFGEKKKGFYKVSLRGKGRVNVAEIAALFGGGGHHNAAGCEVKGSLEEVKRRVFMAVKKSVTNTNKLNSKRI